MLSSLVVIAGKRFRHSSRSVSVDLARPRHVTYVSIRLEHSLQAQAGVEHESISLTKLSRRRAYVETCGYKTES